MPIAYEIIDLVYNTFSVISSTLQILILYGVFPSYAQYGFIWDYWPKLSLTWSRFLMSES